jgi:hypothetical protein
LPSDLQSQYNTFYNAIPGATTSAAFTLPNYNTDQTQAFSNIENSANPTSQSIGDLVKTYQNPYDQSVIDGINRQANGQYSILKQSLNEAGQQNSNRQDLGANDIDLSRQQQIGQFEQSQFNNSLNTGLQQQQLNNQNLLGIGNFQQNQSYQNQLAPYAALQAQAGLLNPAANFLSGSQPATTVKTDGGLMGLLNGLSGTSSALSNLGGFFGGSSSGSSSGGGGSDGSDVISTVAKIAPLIAAFFA